MLKEIILVREEKQLNKLLREFKRENDVDGSMGECCCNWPNAEGAKKIQLFDRLFIVNVPRFIMAHWANMNAYKFSLYAKVRYISFFFQAFFMFFGIIGYVFFETFKSKKNWGRN